MADIVLGLGSSHGPLLSTPPEEWHQRAEADRRNTGLWYRGRQWTFDDLVRERGGPEAFREDLDLTVRRERRQACDAAIDSLSAALYEAAPDVVVIVTDDQREVFSEQLQPTMGIFHGDEVAHMPLAEEQLTEMGPGLAVAASGHVPDEPRTYPCAPDLALHAIHSLMEDGFDVAASRRLPAGSHEDHSIGHGFGFVYKRIMPDPLPMLPVFVNSFYPPNQPTAARCYAFGQALGRAFTTWGDARRIAVVASGGLTHFVIDEDFDRAFLDALAREDAEYLSSIPGEQLQSGTSEVRNWIVVAGALSGSGRKMQLLDYVPCYRSEAGTGSAMGFAVWK